MNKKLIFCLIAIMMLCSLCTFAEENDGEENAFKLVAVPSGRYLNYDTEYMLTYPKNVYFELKLNEGCVISDNIVIESLDPSALNFEDPDAVWPEDGTEPEPVAILNVIPDENGLIEVSGKIYFLGEYVIVAKDPENSEEVCRWTIKVDGLYEDDIRFKDGMVMEKMMLEGSKGHRHNYVDTFVYRTEYTERGIIHTCTFCGFNYKENF